MKYVLICELCGEEVASMDVQEEADGADAAEIAEQIKAAEYVTICHNCGSTDFVVGM